MEHKDTILEEEIVKDDVQDEVENEETTEDNVVDIEEKLEEKKLRDEIDTLNDQYKRLQAEYANYRRRTQEEKETIGIFANEKMLSELIPVIDSMERALDACTDKEDTMFKGVELVYKQLKDMITKFGVEEISRQGQIFDPSLEQALVVDSVDEYEDDVVLEVLLKGYKLKDRVIRPASVKINQK